MIERSILTMSYPIEGTSPSISLVLVKSCFEYQMNED